MINRLEIFLTFLFISCDLFQAVIDAIQPLFLLSVHIWRFNLPFLGGYTWFIVQILTSLLNRAWTSSNRSLRTPIQSTGFVNKLVFWRSQQIFQLVLDGCFLFILCGCWGIGTNSFVKHTNMKPCWYYDFGQCKPI